MSRSRKIGRGEVLRALAGMASTLALTAVFAPAAAGATLATSVSSASPARNVPIEFTFSWTNVPAIDDQGGPYLYAVARPSGTPCATTHGADPGSAKSEFDIYGDSPNRIPPGDSSTTVAWYPQVGSYTVCAWLETDGADYSGTLMSAARHLRLVAGD